MFHVSSSPCSPRSRRAGFVSLLGSQGYTLADWQYSRDSETLEGPRFTSRDAKAGGFVDGLRVVVRAMAVWA